MTITRVHWVRQMICNHGHELTASKTNSSFISLLFLNGAPGSIFLQRLPSKCNSDSNVVPVAMSLGRRVSAFP